MNQKRVKLLRRLFGGYKYILDVSPAQIVINGKRSVNIRGLEHSVPTFMRVTGELKRKYRNEKKNYMRLPAVSKEIYAKSLLIYLMHRPTQFTGMATSKPSKLW